MSQRRLRNYKHDLLSFEHNIFNLGMHNAGRYCGFDTMFVDNPNDSPMRFTLKHSGTGIFYKDPVNIVTGPIGVTLTPQGDIVFEDAPVGPFDVDTNEGNAEIRYDLVVFNHDHIVSVGGVNGTYSIIRGDFGTPTKPILTDPLKQTAMGIIELPPNASALNNVCKYTKIKCPDSGDGEDARLLEPNVFKAIQIQKESKTTYASPSVTATFSGVNAKLYTLENNGNVFSITTPYVGGPNTLDGLRIKDITLQDGARIYINIDENMIVRQTSFFMPTYGTKGYRPFKMNIGMANIAYPGGDNGVGIRPSVGEIWEMECVLNNDQWFIVSLGGCGTNSVFKRGMTMLWYGDLLTNFNNDGRGINIMTGWQICNGLNTAVDLRGKNIVGATVGVPALGAPDITTMSADDQLNYSQGDVYTFDGKVSKQITQSNLPNYNLIGDPHEHLVASINGTDNGDDYFLWQHPAEHMSWTSYGHDGNQDYTMHATPNGNMGGKSSPVNVNVPSGGGNIPFEFLPPVFRHVYIQKV